MNRARLFSNIRGMLPETQRINEATHAGLWLDKYIDSFNGAETAMRPELVREVSALPEPQAYKIFYQRWEQILTDLGAQKRVAEVKGRMIIGLGSESVLETSVTLHRTYGIPYIPGSALKGLAASYARHYLGEAWQKDREPYKVVFGDTDTAGYIIFLDALYIPGTGHKGKALYPDVITVHHQEYYQGTNNAPADWDDPNPVPFMSATGHYLIALAAPELHEGQEWISYVFRILEQALKHLGIGAKTSSGYGRMKLELLAVDVKAPKPEPIQPSQTSQTSSAPASAPQQNWQRPNIPQFQAGAQIQNCVVIKPTEVMRQGYPKAQAFLRYRELSPKYAYIVIDEAFPEAQTWNPGQSKSCIFILEEQREGSLVLICKPKAK